MNRFFELCRYPVSAAALILFLTAWASRPFQKAPDFTLPALDGSVVQLSEIYREKPVLLVFWASWCPSCRDEIPHLKKISQEYGKDQLQVIAVNVQENRAVAEAFVRDQGIAYPVVLDENGQTAEDYKIEGLPVSVLLAKGGEILYYGFSLPGNLSKLLDTRRFS